MDAREKRYVPVIVRFDSEGRMRPLEIEFDEAHKYPVDKVLDVRRAACQSVGGVGDRYTDSRPGNLSLDGKRPMVRLCEGYVKRHITQCCFISSDFYSLS